jgi:rare lipoprotein A
MPCLPLVATPRESPSLGSLDPSSSPLPLTARIKRSLSGLTNDWTGLKIQIRSRQAPYFMVPLAHSLVRVFPLIALILVVAVAGGCSSASKQRQDGLASWYGPKHHGKKTASGQPFNQNALTAAHPSLPFGTQVRVTNLANGKQVVVSINDRGPYKGGRIIDLSRAAARKLEMDGIARVRVEVLSN